MLFVTAFAGILDLDTGELQYCNAGHENPFLMRATDTAVRRIEDGDGPPLCAVADFAYEGGRWSMQRDEILCIVTDGVTEALNREGALYGSARVADDPASLGSRAGHRGRRRPGAARRRGGVRRGRRTRGRSHDSACCGGAARALSQASGVRLGRGRPGRGGRLLAPTSFSRRWNSGESMMIVPAAARRRSTASGGSTNVVGCRFR